MFTLYQVTRIVARVIKHREHHTLHASYWAFSIQQDKAWYLILFHICFCVLDFCQYMILNIFLNWRNTLIINSEKNNIPVILLNTYKMKNIVFKICLFLGQQFWKLFGEERIWITNFRCFSLCHKLQPDIYRKFLYNFHLYYIFWGLWDSAEWSNWFICVSLACHCKGWVFEPCNLKWQGFTSFPAEGQRFFLGTLTSSTNKE